MTATTYIRRLALSAAGLGLLGLILRATLGARWFSFYGWASLALLAAVIFGWLVFKRYRTLKIRTWPAILLFLSIVIAAIVQAGFWIAFFNLGDESLLLAAARANVMPHLEPFLLPGAIVLAIATTWIVIRGALMRAPTEG